MRTQLIALTLTTLTLATSTPAAEPSAHRQLLFHTGIEYQAAAVPGLVAESAADNRARCSLADDSITERALPHFATKPLIDDTRKRLAARIDGQRANRLLGWFQSKLGQRIAELEKRDPATIAPSDDTRALIEELASRKGEARHPRARAILAIVEHTRVAQYTAATGSEIEYAGAVSSGCAEQHASSSGAYRFERKLTESIRSNQSLLRQIVQYEAPLEMARLFQSLSDAELQAYSRFAQSEDARHFFDALVTSFSESFRAASTRARHASQRAQATLSE